MPRILPSAIIALSVCATQLTAAQTPAYKLLWSPANLDSPGGQPTVIFEVAPGLFYVLGALVQNTFGASVFSVTSDGIYKPLYSLPPNFESFAQVQATNGKLYNPGFNGNTKQNLYFSASAAGKDLVEYPFPAGLGSAWQTIAAPGGIYDIVGGPGPQGSTIFDFAQISNTGQFTILHQFSGSDGAPTGIDLALGADGNFYGVGNQQHGGISPGFIFRLTPKGEYSQLVSFPEFPANGFLQAEERRGG
jgi:hypothetical protein